MTGTSGPEKDRRAQTTTRQPRQRPVAASWQNRKSNMQQGQQQRNRKPGTIAEMSQRRWKTQTGGGEMPFSTLRQTPWNKGRAYVAGRAQRRGRFKPGQKPRMWHQSVMSVLPMKAICSERWQIQASPTRLCKRPPSDLAGAGNDIPPANILIFRDGNKANFALENLELITRKGKHAPAIACTTRRKNWQSYASSGGTAAQDQRKQKAKRR